MSSSFIGKVLDCYRIIERLGIGMEEDIKEKLFESFYSTKKEGEGTGLGLSTVYGIVKQNSGIIHLESEPGVGTIFEIYWPVSNEQAVEDTLIETEIQFKQNGETILLVEDDSEVRTWVSGALKSLGYNIIEAEDGERALDMVVNDNLIDKIDLLLSDMVMPEINGEELADNIKAIKPSIKIILCSATAKPRCMKEGNL